MVALLIIVSIGFVVCLGLLVFGPQRAGGAAPRPIISPVPPPTDAARGALEGDPDRRRREVEELRGSVNELRAELKATKKKLHELREGDRSGQDLLRARHDVERNASQQLEVVRSELAGALGEVARLRAESDAFRSRRPAPAPPVSSEPAPAGRPHEAVERPVRRFRELSDTDREKMERLEHQANRERTRAQELSAEVRRLRSRNETQHRLYVVNKGERELVKDKFKALEKRLNRTLLERDLMKRAIRDLEKRSGIVADRTEPTQEELAASDRSVDERARAEAAALDRRTAQASEELARSGEGRELTPTAAASGAGEAPRSEADEAS